MISCTDFIPAYSELFRFLEENYGRDEVDRYWNFLFNPGGGRIPLTECVLKEGIRGCFTYWSGTLNEEAADFTMYLNEPAGWFMIDMHRCPSKGRLLDLQKEIGIEPYHRYCLHCDLYRLAVEQVGLTYIYNFLGVDRAACSILIYDPKIFRGQILMDENTEIVDRKADDNEYFHRDFHNGMNSGIVYVAEKFGEEAVKAYLARYAKHALGGVIEEAKRTGVDAIEAHIRQTYQKEKDEDALSIENKDGVLTVQVAYCPAVRHLRSKGQEPAQLFNYTTETVMKTLAEEAGLHFAMISYDRETGAATYSFRIVNG